MHRLERIETDRKSTTEKERRSVKKNIDRGDESPGVQLSIGKSDKLTNVTHSDLLVISQSMLNSCPAL